MLALNLALNQNGRHFLKPPYRVSRVYFYCSVSFCRLRHFSFRFGAQFNCQRSPSPNVFITFTRFLQPDHLLRDIQTVALVRNPNPFYHIHSHLNGNISLRGQFGLPYIQNTRKKEKKMRAQQTACN